MMVAPSSFPAFPPPGFPTVAPSIPDHPEFQWRNRNQGTPASRDSDFIRSIRHIAMKRTQRLKEKLL